MTRTRQAVFAAGVVLAGMIVYGLASSPRPTQSEKDRASVETAADRITHQEIADAWAQTKLGNTAPMDEIKKTFPFPIRGIREEGTAIVLTFTGHNQTCIDFRTQPDGSIVSGRPC